MRRMAKSDAQVSRSDVASCEVEDLRRALAQEQEQNIRLRAEFDNYRRRAARDREAAGAAGRRDALRHLLPVLDALERALASGEPAIVNVMLDPDAMAGHAYRGF